MGQTCVGWRCTHLVPYSWLGRGIFTWTEHMSDQRSRSNSCPIRSSINHLKTEESGADGVSTDRQVEDPKPINGYLGLVWASPGRLLYSYSSMWWGLCGAWREASRRLRGRMPLATSCDRSGYQWRHAFVLSTRDLESNYTITYKY